ncbi:MAG: hypothetical protein AB1529_00640 [Candidatus Micrarchaeota archaeon]
MRKALLALLLLGAACFPHSDSIESLHDDPWAFLGVPNPLHVLYAAALVSGLAVFYAIFARFSEEAKKLVFFVIAAPIGLSTIYLGATTVYLNAVSESAGPVHWHADFEIWACGEKYELADPSGLDNKVGSPVVHEHNDNRMHVEGVLLKKGEASLRNFLIQAGGNFDEDSLTLPTNAGVMSWNDGDLCNGRPARWHVFVNGEPLGDDAHDYVISPYELVPPGDAIKFVFTEKKPDEVNPDIGGPP